MAETSVQDTMSGPASSTAATILRTRDPLAEALRDEASMDLDDIARINRVLSPTYDASSIPGTPTDGLFSAQDKSTSTEPSSIDTSLPNKTYKGKGKARVEASNASSLSAACGSASEAEAQRPDVRREALLAVGDWATATLVSDEPLRGAARAKTRRHRVGPRKVKKPVVEIVQHIEPGNLPLVENCEATVTVAAAHNGPDKTYLRKRGTQHDENHLRLAEEGQNQAFSAHQSLHRPLSRIRVYLLALLIGLMVLTISLSFLGAHYTGKGQMACTKGIVFGTTVLMAFLTILAMIVASRAPHEALLAGLLEIIIGFTLLLELDDFM